MPGALRRIIRSAAGWAFAVLVVSVSAGCVRWQQTYRLTGDGQAAHVVIEWTLDRAQTTAAGFDDDAFAAQAVSADRRAAFEKLSTELLALREFTLPDEWDVDASADDDLVAFRVQLREAADFAGLIVANPADGPLRNFVGPPVTEQVDEVVAWRAPVHRGALRVLAPTAENLTEDGLEFRVAITAPGPVVAHNGVLDDRTVTWDLADGSPDMLQVSWRDEQTASAGAILVSTALLVLIVGGGVLLVRRAR